jgi:hypothetical protein
VKLLRSSVVYAPPTTLGPGVVGVLDRVYSNISARAAPELVDSPSRGALAHTVAPCGGRRSPGSGRFARGGRETSTSARASSWFREAKLHGKRARLRRHARALRPSNHGTSAVGERGVALALVVFSTRLKLNRKCGKEWLGQVRAYTTTVSQGVSHVRRISVLNRV